MKNQSEDGKVLAGVTTERAAETADLQSGLAGRELDAAVAERVMVGVGHVDDGDGFCARCHQEMMEWRIMRFKQQGGNPPAETPCVPEYSTDIAAAWLIIEHLQRHGCMVSVNASSELGKWWGVVYPTSGGYFESDTCDSPAEAICHAALQATKSSEASNLAEKFQEKNQGGDGNK